MWQIVHQSELPGSRCRWSALILAVSSIALADEPPAQQTLYDGRTLSEWRERIKSVDYQGPDIGRDVPGLLAICQDPAAPWFSRRQAALTLGRIGQPAQSAVPDIIALLDEPGDDPEQSTRFWAIKTLALFGPLAADATPTLVGMLEDDTQSPLCRLATIEALGRIGPTEPAVLPAITRTLDAGLAHPGTQDPDTMERAVAAAEILELFRGQGASATPSLIRAAASDDLLLRRAAANTLGLVGPAAAPALPALADLVLFDDVPEVRDLAARSIGRIGAEAQPVLMQLLQDHDPDVRVRAASACRELGDATAPMIAALQAAASDDDPRVRIAAIESLWAITADAGIVAPPAIAELEHDDREVRIRAMRLLESLGTDVIPWLSRLQSLAADERSDVARAAQRVLRNLNPDQE